MYHSLLLSNRFSKTTKIQSFLTKALVKIAMLLIWSKWILIHFQAGRKPLLQPASSSPFRRLTSLRSTSWTSLTVLLIHSIVKELLNKFRGCPSLSRIRIQVKSLLAPNSSSLLSSLTWSSVLTRFSRFNSEVRGARSRRSTVRRRSKSLPASDF